MKALWILPILLLLLPGAVSAVGYDNFTAPTIDYDIREGQYNQYWLTDLTSFPVYGLIYAICKPFIDIFGYWFFAILYFVYLGTSYLRTGSVTLPVTVGLISGTVWGAIMPPETFVVGYVLLATGIVTILIKFYMRDNL
jgi:hypothetical protein